MLTNSRTRTVMIVVGAAALVAGLLLKDTKYLPKTGQESLAAAVPAPTPQSVAARTAPPGAPTAPAPPPEPPPTPADGTQIPRGSQRWTAEGRVFDPVARKPLADVQLVFTERDTKARFSARIDRKGRYQAQLAWSSAGYGLSIKAGVKKLNFMEDWIPSLLSMPAEKSMETAAELAARPPTVEDVFGAPGAVEKKVWLAVPGRPRP